MVEYIYIYIRIHWQVSAVFSRLHARARANVCWRAHFQHYNAAIQQRRGIKLGGLATLWDLYATFGHLAGLSDADAVRDDAAAAAGLPPVDSINQWGWWSGAGDASAGTAGGAGGGGSVVLGVLPVPPRAELAIGAAYGNGHGASNSFLATTVEGLIQGEMKLIMTPPAFPILEAAWSGLQFPNASTNQTDWDATSLDCSSGCLYNLTNDRSEHNNLAAEHPDTVAKMTARMREINATAFSPQRGASSPLGCEVALDTYGGFWVRFYGCVNCRKQISRTLLWGLDCVIAAQNTMPARSTCSLFSESKVQSFSCFLNS